LSLFSRGAELLVAEAALHGLTDTQQCDNSTPARAANQQAARPTEPL